MKARPWKWSPKFRRGTFVWVFWPTLAQYHMLRHDWVGELPVLCRGFVSRGRGFSGTHAVADDKIVPVTLIERGQYLWHEDEVFVSKEEAERVLMVMVMARP